MNDPRLLAGGAAGLVSTLLALWAFRGLPIGTAFFWLSPLPLFAAGLGFGQGALWAATGLGLVLMLAFGGGYPAGIWLVAFGAPALAFTAAAIRGRSAEGRLDAGMPLALLGLYPALVILIAAFVASDVDGGLEGVLRQAVTGGLSRLDLPTDDTLVTQVARLMAGALAFWMAVAIAANGAAAQNLLVRRGWAAFASPAWAEARLPVWFPALPALAGLWCVVASADAVSLSLTVALLIPFFFQGLGVIHRLGRDIPARPFLLGGFYAALVVFIFPMAIVIVGIGLFSQFGWRPSPPQT